MSNSGGYTFVPDGYENVGIVHKGEYVVPLPFDYPRWWIRIRKFVWPQRLRVAINKRVRTYNPEKDLMRHLTGKEYPHE